jgi:hypothetical protein
MPPTAAMGDRRSSINAFFDEHHPHHELLTRPWRKSLQRHSRPKSWLATTSSHDRRWATLSTGSSRPVSPGAAIPDAVAVAAPDGVVTTLRSRRLGAILDARVHQVEADHVRSL